MQMLENDIDVKPNTMNREGETVTREKYEEIVKKKEEENEQYYKRSICKA